MIEVNCETNFAAVTKIFKDLAHNLAMHIAAMNPTCISQADISPETIAEEKNIYETQARNENKPDGANHFTEIYRLGEGGAPKPPLVRS